MPNANANPEKRFFIDLITRDISLEDAILDLIDNAIDSLLRTRAIDPYKDLICPEGAPAEPLAEIRIKFSPKQFKIVDNCGGIPFESAEKDVFRFGHPDPHSRASLSVFGIGMKRAIFKIGRQIEIESHSTNSGFLMKLDVDNWLGEQETDWKIPLDQTSGEQDLSKAGTTIVISRLRKEVATLMENPTFENRLFTTIQEAYPFYLEKYVRISVNKKEVEGEDLTFAESQNLKPTIETWEDGKVEATLICGLLPRKDDKWQGAKSGWYLVCNGRVIVNADQTKLTGWGKLLPQFMPKNRGFLGIVFFKSDQPEELPWNTTKRGIDTESAVFIRTLKRMIAASRPVIRVQNKMYAGKDDDEPKEEYRDSVRDLQSSSATETVAKLGESDNKSERRAFFFIPPTSRPKTTTIQFKVKKEDIALVKKRLGRTSMPNYKVGEKVFKYFLDRECSK
jgi:hypothetical protein